MAPVLIPRKRSLIRPHGVSQINYASPQAENLLLWYSLNQGAGRTIIGFHNNVRSSGTFIDQNPDSWDIKPDGGYGLKFDTADRYVDVGETHITATYPITYIAYVWKETSVINSTFFMNRSTDNAGLMEPNAAAGTLAYQNFDGNGWQWTSGPAIVTGEFSINVVTIYEGVDTVDAWVVSRGGGFDKETESRGRTKTSGLLDDLDIGNDEFGYNLRYVRGTLFDIRIVQKRYTDNDVWGLWEPQTRWDLYWQPRLYIPVYHVPDQDIEGSILIDADTLNQGDVDHGLSGSILTDVDTIFNGFVQPFNMFGSTLEDEDTLSQGDIDHSLFGSILTDGDTFNDGLITLNVESSFLLDADILNHGLINNSDIRNSLLVDTDTFNSGEVISAGQLQGSILEDVDTFFDSRLVLPMFGSILEDADILHHGTFFIDIMGSLLEDTNILNHGIMGNSRIDGSLFQDSDSLFGGLVEDDLGPVYRIITIATVVGGGDIVDLIDEVVLASARGALIGKHRVEIDETSV